VKQNRRGTIILEFSRVEIFTRARQSCEGVSGHKHGFGKTVIVLYTVFSDRKLKTNNIYNYTLNTDQQRSQLKAVKSARKNQNMQSFRYQSNLN
jgi:hypothetical protein